MHAKSWPGAYSAPWMSIFVWVPWKKRSPAMVVLKYSTRIRAANLPARRSLMFSKTRIFLGARGLPWRGDGPIERAGENIDAPFVKLLAQHLARGPQPSA